MQPESSKRFEFEGVLVEHPTGLNATYLVVPFDVKEAFGTRGQVKIKATFDGVTYRGSLAPMGGGQHVLGVTQAIRKALGKGPGDKVKVVLEADVEPRVVTVPPDFQKALESSPRAGAAFDQLSFTHRKEWVQWIEDAKKADTRARRIQVAVERIALHQKLANP